VTDEQTDGLTAGCLLQVKLEFERIEQDAFTQLGAWTALVLRTF